MSEDQSYEIPQLWALAELERPGEQGPSKQQVAAWKKVSTDVDSHAKALRTAAAKLTSSWPPESSEAARQFSNFVKEFIASMETTRDDSTTIANALGHIDDALRDVKQQLSDLNAKWTKNLELEKNATSTLEGALNGAAAGASAGVTGVVAGGIVGAMTSGSNLPEDWKKKLKAEAHTRFVTLNSKVSEALVGLTGPPEYIASIGLYKDSSSTASGEGRQSAGSGSARQLSSSGERRVDSQIPPLSQPPTIDEQGNIVVPGTDGPSLTGTGTSTLTPPSATGPTPTSSSQSLPGRVIGMPGGPPLGYAPGMGGMSPRSTPGRGTAGRPSAMGPFGGTSQRGAAGRRVMPPGGVIGGTGQTGGRTGAGKAGTAGRSGSAGRGVGRVIGSANTQGTKAPGAGGSRRFKDSRREFDPDDPWYVEQGVPPVIEPPAETHRHDPGPGVIGMDR